MYIPIYRKWWFWVLTILILIPLGWKSYHMTAWQLEQWRYDSADKTAIDFMKEQDKVRSDWETAQKIDTHGGATPEETLRLFIEALEKKDYVLASRYYVVEEQENAYKDFQTDIVGNPFQMLISAHESGKIISNGNSESLVWEIKVFAKGDDIPFGFRFKQNKFTNIWKLTEK